MVHAKNLCNEFYNLVKLKVVSAKRSIFLEDRQLVGSAPLKDTSTEHYGLAIRKKATTAESKIGNAWDTCFSRSLRDYEL